MENIESRSNKNNTYDPWEINTYTTQPNRDTPRQHKKCFSDLNGAGNTATSRAPANTYGSAGVQSSPARPKAGEYVTHYTAPGLSAENDHGNASPRQGINAPLPAGENSDALDTNHPDSFGVDIDFDSAADALDDQPAINETYKPSGIKISFKGEPVPSHRDSGYTGKLGNYIRNTLLPQINQQGKAPLLLRPLAAIASWSGYHGVGQTNCLSCAASVADTLKQGILHKAFPTLRGSSPFHFTTLQEAQNAGRVRLLNSVDQLASYLMGDTGNLNVVLTINRPKAFWRRLFSSVDGHACNIIKTGNIIHLVDAQKKCYIRHELNPAPTDGNPGVPRITSRLEDPLKLFIGAVAPKGYSLRLYNVGW